uniref:BTB domain-containing protein n=1 Tax=Knipowitschia caucasica TaxID=637954 RepID=A0AAV2KWJ9_KNICA
MPHARVPLVEDGGVGWRGFCLDSFPEQGLSALRARGQLLDVELSINQESFRVHKAVLSACSDYFRSVWVLQVSLGQCGYYRSVWVLQVSVGTAGQCGYCRSVWVLQVSVGTAGQSGYYRSVWVLQVSVGTTGQCGYCRSVWVLQVSVGTAGQCGYCRSVWVLQVSVGTAGQCGYCRSVWVLQVSVGTTGQCGYYRSVWVLQVSVGTTGQSGYCRSVWVLQVSLGTSGQCGYCRSVWVLQVSVGTAGQCGYYRSVWVLQVSVGTAGQCGYCRSVWVLQVSVGTAGQCGYYRSVWVLQVSVGTAGQCGYCRSVWVLQVSVGTAGQSGYYRSVWVLQVSVRTAGQCGYCRSVWVLQVSVGTAGQCGYYRAMFTGGMRESTQEAIELRGLSARGLKHIIDFAYSAEMLPVVELCEEFLKSAMSVDTCLHIGQMATAFSLASLKESVDTFTFRHFRQISEQEDFLQLPLERLLFFLQSNKLKACSELDLFHAAIRWLQFEEDRRAQASAVLSHVRFPLMRSSELVDSVQKVDVMVEDVECRQFLLEAFNYQILPFRQHEMQCARTLIRSDVLSLITFGGTPYTDHDRTVSSRVYQLPDTSARHFKELTEMEAGVSHACVAALDNFVYVVGGQHLQYRSGEGAVDSCYRYDPHLNQWLRIQNLQEARIQFQLNVLHGKLYATGGRNRSGSLCSVEVYCPKKNEWSYAQLLKRRVWGHAAATCAERLYVSGGYGVSLDDKKALHCYDAQNDQWEFKAPMTEPRVLHAMVSCGERVYAVGGRMDHVDRCFDVLALECYSPESDSWSALSPMRVGQSEAGCCLLQHRIYVIGGYNWHLNNVTSVVQVFNTRTDEWERDLHFPESFAGIACTPIILPQSAQL